MRNISLDNGGQGGHASVMPIQPHNAGEPPKLDNEGLPSPAPVGEPKKRRSAKRSPTFNVTIRRRPTPKPVVYFVQAANGLIKIGNTKFLEGRLASLGFQSPVSITLLAVTKGDRKTEFEYHASFAAHRRHGEWFEPHPDILTEIDRLNGRPATGRQSSAGLTTTKGYIRHG